MLIIYLTLAVRLDLGYIKLNLLIQNNVFNLLNVLISYYSILNFKFI